jgi:hypothetical protein
MEDGHGEHHTPTGLIFSRQNITDLPAVSKRAKKKLLKAEKGGYVQWFAMAIRT